MPLKSAEGDVGIDGQPFDLVEHVAVRRVGIVAAIDFARHDDAHRRRLLLHGANLHGRSVRAQQVAAASAFDVESVHVVARGMMLGNVERLEIVVRRLDLGPFDHAEADGKKNPLQLFVGLADQVARADRPLDAGKREVDLFAGLGSFFRSCFDFLALFFKRRFDVGFEFVQFLPDDALEFRRRWLEPVVADERENAGLAAKPGVAHGFSKLQASVAC